MSKAAILVFLEGNRRPAKIELDEVVVATIVSPLTLDTMREERVLGHAAVECLRTLEEERARASAPITLGVDPIPSGTADPTSPIADPVPPEAADPADRPDGLGTLTLA